MSTSTDAARSTATDVLRRGPIRWLRARVSGTRLETRDARTLTLEVPGWPGHDPGQHVDVRLTAEDGYMAQRSYSIASVGSPGSLELTIQKVSTGEVSPYFVETIQVGDEFELRGPIGGWFRWTGQLDHPVTLLGGGSGIVPLMAMLRARVDSTSRSPFHLVYSARNPDDIFYADELHRIASSCEGVTISYVFTRSGLPGHDREPGRLRAEDLPVPSSSAGIQQPRAYVCGPNGFVEAASQILLERGYPASAIRTERFGPTGA
ncbi:ferredoxin reductase [Aeromicrobium sp. CF3.5]|uniref:ferredoxin reductase n=1 Tax=Aeromicrobium sp. CF3.5 TaxID=3373078 RepID=UPI003EE57ADF